MLKTKDEKTMCGSACVKWICDNENVQISINDNEIWCCSLALCLQKAGFNLKVKCFNSKLYDDCLKFSDQKFEGFESIRNYIKENKIQIEQPTIENILKEIVNHKYVIYNVSSAKFHKNKSLNGGHYIVVAKANDNTLEIINPRKTDFEIKNITTKHLIDCIKDFGCWRILVD